MSIPTVQSIPVTMTQIETAIRFMPRSMVVQAWKPTVRPEQLRITVDERDEAEEFIMRLAMIVCGDALTSSVSGLPTVVDAQELMETVTSFRTAMEDMEGSFQVTFKDAEQ